MTEQELRRTQFGGAIRAGESIGLRFMHAQQSPGGYFSWQCGERGKREGTNGRETKRVGRYTFSRYPKNALWYVTGFDSSDMYSMLSMEESTKPQAS